LILFRGDIKIFPQLRLAQDQVFLSFSRIYPESKKKPKALINMDIRVLSCFSIHRFAQINACFINAV